MHRVPSPGGVGRGGPLGGARAVRRSRTASRTLARPASAGVRTRQSAGRRQHDRGEPAGVQPQGPPRGPDGVSDRTGPRDGAGRRNRSRPQGHAAFDGVRDGLPPLASEQRDVDRHPVRAAAREHPDGRPLGTAVHDSCQRSGVRDGLQHGRDPVDDDLLLDGPQPAEPARRRQGAGEHSRHGRLVELDHDLRPRDQPAHLGDLARQPLGERAHQVAAGAGVHDGPLEPGQVEPRGERPRPGALQLQRPRVLVGDLGEHVQVLPEPGLRTGEVAPGPVHEPPPHGLQVDGHVHEKGRRAADQIGAGAAAGQLGQVRHVRLWQLAEAGPDGVDDVRAGPRADPAGTPGHGFEHRASVPSRRAPPMV